MRKRIAEETISLIQSRADIIDIIGEYVQLKKSGRDFQGLCPFHSEKTPSFRVSPEKKLYHCFGCGAGGNVFTFLMEMEGYTFLQAVQTVGEKVGVRVHLETGEETRLVEPKHEEKQLMIQIHEITAKLFHHFLLERSEGERAREYLKKRGIRMETVVEFQIGYAPDSWDFLKNFLERRKYPLDLVVKAGLITKGEGEKFYDRFRDRIMYPIWDSQGRVVAFGGRILGDGQPKYLNSPESLIFQKSRILYNFHRARQQIRKEQTAILLEGYNDVISAWQSGVENVVATMGTALSEQQGRMIRRNSERVILCLDGDQAGVGAIKKAAEVLAGQGSVVKVGALPEDLDPDDYIRRFGGEAFRKKIIQDAKSYTAFSLEALKRGKNMQDEDDRLNYIKEALLEISRLKRAVERDHYLRKLADEYSLSFEALKQEQYHVYLAQKRNGERDKAGEKWNNSRDTNKHLVAQRMFPAYQTAERKLLAHMLINRQVAEHVQQKVGSHFNIDEHNALAAYLYAFYIEGNEANVQHFISRLTDQELIQLAAELSMIDVELEPSQQVIDDYIAEILTYPLQLHIQQKEAEKKRLEQEGESLHAAHVGNEIIALKRELQRQKKRQRP